MLIENVTVSSLRSSSLIESETERSNSDCVHLHPLKMGLGCGTMTAKYILFLFNILIWIAACVLLGFGIWFLVDPNALNFFKIAPTSEALVRGVAIAFVSVGALAFITGFLGCCGAKQENTCMLKTYAAILVVLLIIQVAAGIGGVVSRERIGEELNKSMNDTVQVKYGVDTDATEAFDILQKEFTCCGANGPSDWSTSAWKKSKNESVPDTCCVMGANAVPVNKTLCNTYAQNTTSTDAPNYIHVEGCQEGLLEWVQDNAAILIGVAFGLALLQVFVVLLACCLKNNYRRGYEYV